MPVSLIVVKGRSEGQRIPISTREFLIGRDERCHLRPKSNLVSKWHCVLLIRRGGVYLKDLNSLNGTFVNGRRIRQEVRLNNGDLIGVGPLVFAVAIEQPVAQEPARHVDPDLEEAVMDWVLAEQPWASSPTPGDSPESTTIMDAPTVQAPPAEAQTGSKSEETTERSEERERPASSTAEVADRLLEKLFEPRRRS